MPDVEIKTLPPGKVNTSDDQIRANIAANIRRQLPQVKPHEPQDLPVCLVAGGPSLNNSVADIRRCVRDGYGIVAVNGTAEWLLKHKITPHAHVVLDARPHNVRFVQQSIPGCKYMLASQCDPALFEAVKEHETWIWHCGSSAVAKEELDGYYLGHYHMVSAGSTVALGAIYLLRMLGFERFEIFGFDSCVLGDAHHAYAQAENDHQRVVRVEMGSHTFYCQPWMLSQFEDFVKATKHIGHLVEMIVHGNGLIATWLRLAADGRLPVINSMIEGSEHGSE
jgi:hypothetical protein